MECSKMLALGSQGKNPSMIDLEERVKYYCNDNHALTYFGFQDVEVSTPLCRFVILTTRVHKEGYVNLSPPEKCSSRRLEVSLFKCQNPKQKRSSWRKVTLYKGWWNNIIALWQRETLKHSVQESSVLPDDAAGAGWGIASKSGPQIAVLLCLLEISAFLRLLLLCLKIALTHVCSHQLSTSGWNVLYEIICVMFNLRDFFFKNLS